ncbi:MAG TPA: hypothetical protein VG738_13605 [Chitinophagaceae bacterium]|nr:hypothetical protein [Chitinophagaceae bacterium]
MKRNLLIGTGCITAALVMLYACQKQLSPSIAAPALKASTTNAATGEKVSLSVTNMPPGTHLIWMSTSSGYASFNSTGQGIAAVSFSKPGTYKITCYIISGEGADSIPAYDTSFNPYDTVPNYPPPPPPPAYDSSNYPHDTTYPGPGDTVPGQPHDTMPNYPHDTATSYPHDTTPQYPHDTLPGYPPTGHDTTHYPYDSTYVDSLVHAHNNHIMATVTISITVH